MSVAGSPRRSPSCRWRKRHRPGADWWGPPVRFIVDQGCGYLFACFGISPLVVVLWCVGNPDLWDRGLVCFWGTFLLWLVYPNLPIAWAQARARITQNNFPDGTRLLMFALLGFKCALGALRATHCTSITTLQQKSNLLGWPDGSIAAVRAQSEFLCGYAFVLL